MQIFPPTVVDRQLFASMAMKCFVDSGRLGVVGPVVTGRLLFLALSRLSISSTRVSSVGRSRTIAVYLLQVIINKPSTRPMTSSFILREFFFFFWLFHCSLSPCASVRSIQEPRRSGIWVCAAEARACVSVKIKCTSGLRDHAVRETKITKKVPSCSTLKLSERAPVTFHSFKPIWCGPNVGRSIWPKHLLQPEVHRLAQNFGLVCSKVSAKCFL